MSKHVYLVWVRDSRYASTDIIGVFTTASQAERLRQQAADHGTDAEVLELPVDQDPPWVHKVVITDTLDVLDHTMWPRHLTEELNDWDRRTFLRAYRREEHIPGTRNTKLLNEYVGYGETYEEAVASAEAVVAKVVAKHGYQQEGPEVVPARLYTRFKIERNGAPDGGDQ